MLDPPPSSSSSCPPSSSSSHQHHRRRSGSAATGLLRRGCGMNMVVVLWFGMKDECLVFLKK
ncbi:hypothetical protein HanPI659440_Chr02g0043891 [Helianthus annuus]|nr:hypothetical protein HanPI659440_Chr02g0043891 [Helianthus annuus]